MAISGYPFAVMRSPGPAREVRAWCEVERVRKVASFSMTRIQLQSGKERWDMSLVGGTRIPWGMLVDLAAMVGGEGDLVLGRAVDGVAVVLVDEEGA